MATRTIRRGLPRGILGLAVAGGFGFAVWMILKDGGDGAVPTALFVGLLCLGALSQGLAGLLCAFAPDCYLRAGPEGIEARCPGVYWPRVHRYDIRWAEIAQWQPYVVKINLMVADCGLEFHLHNRKYIKICTMAFREKAVDIAKAIQRTSESITSEREAEVCAGI